jgi:hypothetical protein
MLDGGGGRAPPQRLTKRGGPAQRSIIAQGIRVSLPDRAEKDFAIMHCRTRVVPLGTVNERLRLGLVLTRIAKPMNRFAACGDPRVKKPKGTQK